MDTVNHKILFETHVEPSGVCYVYMRMDGATVGFAGYQAKNRSFQIVIIDVERKHRHRGYGTFLVGFLEASARVAQCDEVRLCLLNGGSYDFWVKMGFKKIGDSLYMRKKIG
jgi:N-acetylglutamate synthase-like GNAT family acetyltransferase